MEYVVVSSWNLYGLLEKIRFYRNPRIIYLEKREVMEKDKILIRYVALIEHEGLKQVRRSDD